MDTLHAFLERSSDAIMEYDSALRYRWLNASALAFLGMERNQVLGKRNLDLLGAEAAKSIEMYMRQALDTQEVVKVTHDLSLRDRVRYFDTVYTPLLDQNTGEWCLIGHCREVTEQIFSQRKSCTLLKEAQKIAHLGCWEYDPSSGETVWSPELFEVLGLTPTMPSPTYDTFLKKVHLEDREEVERVVDEAIRDKSEFDVRYRIIGDDGKCRHIQARGRHQSDCHSGEGRLVGTAQDITEFVKREIALRDARRQAEAAMRARNHFLSNISHEIRTPMNAILGFSELLKREANSPSALAQIEAIISSGRSLLELINDILDYSKIETGKLTLHAEPQDVHALIMEAQQAFAKKAAEKGLRLSVSNSEVVQQFFCYVDRARLQQILHNLVSNAVKFTQSGTVTLHADIHITDKHAHLGRLTIKVVDSGLGISETHQKRIFEAFEQENTGSNRSYGGTGLGLAISRRLAALMGGFISVESAVGKGSTFTLTLEDVRLQQARTAAASDHCTSSQSYRFKPACVLVAEDHVMNLKLIRHYLSSTSLEVYEATNGQQAVTMAAQIKPDVILMDLSMPVMDGRTAAALIRSMPEIAQTPILVLTGTQPEDQQAITDDLMLRDFLRKPVSENVLLESLARILPMDESVGDTDPKTTEASEPPEQRPEATVSRMLYRQLHGSLFEQWKRANSVFIHDEIIRFARELQAQAQEHESKEISEYAHKILEQAQQFDIDKLRSTMSGYPQLLERLILPKE